MRRRRPRRRSGGRAAAYSSQARHRSRRSKSGHSVSRKTSSAYADCQSRKLRRALLPGGADEQVDVRQVGLVEVAGDRPLVHLVRVEPAGGDLAGDRPGRVGDLRPAAVVHAELQRDHVVVDGHPLGVLQLGDHRPPQPRPPAGPPDPHPQRVSSSRRRRITCPVEAHQEADLVRRAAPVLGRERVRREGADAELDRAVDDVEQRGLAGLVAPGPGQAALVGPPAVAVHDQRDVPRHQLGRDRRRPRPGRMRPAAPAPPGAATARRSRLTPPPSPGDATRNPAIRAASTIRLS